MALKKSLVLAFGLMALVTGRVAYADTISYNLTSNHCDPPNPCGAPGTVFGIVTLLESGTSLGVTVDLYDPYVWAQTGSADFQYFKFNAAGVAVSDITITQNFGARGPLVAATGTFNGDGTGSFGFAIGCPTCGNGITTNSTTLMFTVANANIADLTTANGSLNTNVFVADLGNSTNGATGPIDATNPNERSVPDGGMTMSLLGMAMAGLGLVARRKK